MGWDKEGGNRKVGNNKREWNKGLYKICKETSMNIRKYTIM